MLNLKKIAFAIVIATSMGTISSPVFAEADAGRIVYSPTQAIDLVAGKVGTALEALKSGAKAEQVDDLIKDALSSSKEINASDKVFAARDKIHNKLKSARSSLKSGDKAAAEADLTAAQKAFTALKDLL
ncbi:MAG: hypothetical protein D0528_06090 [Methylococcales bacterium]|nr:MAG: hypothetical protein D0528_06090 [Methylococcales bacterium]